MESKTGKEHMKTDESSPVPNPNALDEARNQTTMNPKSRFPWTTIIIVLILLSVIAAIFVLGSA